MAVAQVPQISQALYAAKWPDEIIADFLKGNDIFRTEIFNAMNLCLVPEDCLSWITDGERQCSWLNGLRLSRLSPHQDRRFRHVSFLPQYLVGGARSIALLDYSFSSAVISNDERVSFCGWFRNTWEQNTRLDRYFSWVRDDEEACCVFLWEWMQSRHARLVEGRTRFVSHDGLLAHFDGTQYLSDLEKVALIEKARRAWNQRRQREKMKGRKQCNFVLSDSVIQKLEKLSLEHGLSRTEIVELIIDSEARSGIHIRERLKQKSLLTSPLPQSLI